MNAVVVGRQTQKLPLAMCEGGQLGVDTSYYECGLTYTKISEYNIRHIAVQIANNCASRNCCHEL